MRRLTIMFGLVGLMAVMLWWLRPNPKPSNPPAASTNPVQGANTSLQATVTATPGDEVPGKPRALLGETILRDYGNPSQPPENDLTLMSRLLDNFLLLVKTAKDKPLSANGDWASALRGGNPARERFLPDQHPALNAQGELVDRWQSALFFHALGGGRYEIRSAGPDRQLWTKDDIHRNYDGSFRRGQELNAASLVDGATRTSR